MHEAGLAAAVVGFARRHQREAVTRATGLDQRDEQIGQRDRFLTDRSQSAVGLGCQHRIDTTFERRQRQHGRRAANESRHARARAVVGRELEGRGVTEPPRKRLAPAHQVHPRHVSRMRPRERGRAWAAVQVLVATADREVGVGAFQIDRHRASGMRQVPHHQRAGSVRRFREVGHAMHPARPIVDVRQHQDADMIVQLGQDVVSVCQYELEPVRMRQCLGNVEVGWEVRPLRQNLEASRRR